ncbi:MAG: PspC domain-containing protein [Bacteroidales bacterium]|nr:PspC domain-containing protein [Bacteroidales bacterium]
MKNIINVSLGGRNFNLEEDAYNRLNQFLEHYRAKLTVPEIQKAEVMQEMEERMAELFAGETSNGYRVVTLPMVENVARVLGMPDGSSESWASGPSGASAKKLYRDLDNKSIAGVCSGLAVYLDLDVTLVRVLMFAIAILGSAGVWIYLILWIVMPVADTPAKKCEMHGVPPTAENMSRFYSKK